MKRFQEQLQSKANSVKMTAAERNDVKERLYAYMEYHPLPAELRTKKASKAKELLRTEPFATIQLPFAMLFKTAGVAFALVLLVIPFAAERAVPGDTLYAVKVQFNEELRSTLTFDSTQKVEWETERVNRRIAEARLLASEGRLTEEAEAEVAAAVKEHTESAQKEIAQLREVDADEAAIAAIALDTTLEVQSSSLKQEEAETPAGRLSTLLTEAIDTSRGQNPTVSSTTPPAFDKLMARVEQNTTRIYELRETVADYVSAERLVEVDRRITDLERIITDAIASFETDENGARQQLVDALQRSQKLIVFITEIEMVETVDIETVVPVVLTPEEKIEKRAELLAELTDKQAQVTELLTTDAKPGILVKATAAATTLEAAVTELASTTSYLVYVERAADAIQLADDTIASFGTVSNADETMIPEETDATSTPPVVPEEVVDVATTTNPVASTSSARGSSTDPVDTAQ